jgi:ADP-ribose pyrophosphatase YjhB (NUDIX family)
MVKDATGRVLKVGIIIYTIDPEKQVRFLLRHSKPFNGYDDEWTVAFGTVEDGTDLMAEAIREAGEEFGIKEFLVRTNLEYEIEFTGKHGVSVIHFFALKAANLEVPVVLNEESIGYDWMKLDTVLAAMIHDDEKDAIWKAYDIALKDI